MMLFEALAASEAVSSGSDRPAKPSPLQLRRWLKFLYDRSLIIGHIEKPMLHDLVADFVQQNIEPDCLRRAHWELVQLFRQRRPDGGWQDRDCARLSKYVASETEHHIRAAWGISQGGTTQQLASSTWRNDVGWLDDFVGGAHDVIPEAAARVLMSDGTALITELAKEAEQDGFWWCVCHAFLKCCLSSQFHSVFTCLSSQQPATFAGLRR